jgi:hypothetical protein
MMISHEATLCEIKLEHGDSKEQPFKAGLYHLARKRIKNADVY